MKRKFFCAVLVTALCCVGLSFAYFGHLQPGLVVATNEVNSSPSTASDRNNAETIDDEYRQALDDYWIDSDQTKYQDYDIDRRCENVGNFENCSLSISQSGRRLRNVEISEGSKNWLKYGFFDFLGNGSKQLIVHTYSGGAHCCYDYQIFDLGTHFRTIYTSEKYDSANQIGNQLVPVDIDGDGVFEFYQDVMAFDYIGVYSHATSSFPPAIFAFDKKSSRYELATKHFPEFVLKRLQENIDRLEPVQKEAEKYETGFTKDEIDEIRTRETFLFWVYAGKREEAWKFFEQNYRSETGDKYQDKLREVLIGDFKQLFAADPTYKSIYETLTH